MRIRSGGGHTSRGWHRQLPWNEEIMKVHIERRNMQVQLIPFRKNIDFIYVGNVEVGNFRERLVYETGLISISPVASCM